MTWTRYHSEFARFDAYDLDHPPPRLGSAPPRLQDQQYNRNVALMHRDAWRNRDEHPLLCDPQRMVLDENHVEIDGVPIRIYTSYEELVKMAMLAMQQGHHVIWMHSHHDREGDNPTYRPGFVEMVENQAMRDLVDRYRAEDKRKDNEIRSVKQELTDIHMRLGRLEERFEYAMQTHAANQETLATATHYIAQLLGMKNKRAERGKTPEEEAQEQRHERFRWMEKIVAAIRSYPIAGGQAATGATAYIRYMLDAGQEEWNAFQQTRPDQWPIEDMIPVVDNLGSRRAALLRHVVDYTDWTKHGYPPSSPADAPGEPTDNKGGA